MESTVTGTTERKKSQLGKKLAVIAAVVISITGLVVGVIFDWRRKQRNKEFNVACTFVAAIANDLKFCRNANNVGNTYGINEQDFTYIYSYVFI